MSASRTAWFTVGGIEEPNRWERLRRRGQAIVGYVIVDDPAVVRLARVNPPMNSADSGAFLDLGIASIDR